MRERVEHITLAELKDLFYRSRFNEVLKILGDIEESGAQLSTEFALIRANTLFELHQVARAMIEAYDKQPVVLLSGRMGYKLASI